MIPPYPFPSIKIRNSSYVYLQSVSINSQLRSAAIRTFGGANKPAPIFAPRISDVATEPKAGRESGTKSVSTSDLDLRLRSLPSTRANRSWLLHRGSLWYLGTVKGELPSEQTVVNMGSPHERLCIGQITNIHDRPCLSCIFQA